MRIRIEDGGSVEVGPEEIARVLKTYADHKARTAVEPEPETAEPVTKRSTSLYLSGGAMRALRTIAANQGVRPHRVLDDALRSEFRRHGFDFDQLNATA